MSSCTRAGALRLMSLAREESKHGRVQVVKPGVRTAVQVVKLVVGVCRW